MPGETELLECPFCGGEGELCSGAVCPMFWVLCRDCHACPGDRPTAEEAIALWNTRAPGSAMDGETAAFVEKLRSSAKAFRENPIYDQDGDGAYLTVQADECEQAASLIEALAAQPVGGSAVGLREALEDVLRTGLNGGDNMRLAYLAAGGKALTDELVAKAEKSEQAVKRALAALAHPASAAEGWKAEDVARARELLSHVPISSMVGKCDMKGWTATKNELARVIAALSTDGADR